jgi:radical SAM-linked protein
MKVQRLRVTFSRGEEVKYTTHLDLMRLWERALRRAGVDLAYSEGFTPHARLSLGAPLAVGVTSGGELMDIFLGSRTSLRRFLEDVTQQLPAGIEILGVEEVGLGVPSLQSEVRWSDYEVEVPADRDSSEVEEAVHRFLASESVPWEHLRDKEVRRYDIRALVWDIRLEGQANGAHRLAMRLRADNTGTGRPEQVASALGLSPPTRIHRRRLVLADSSPAREAWRRRGRFE